MYPTDAPLAYKIDHVGIALADADGALSYCRDDLGLPVAWPLDQYGTSRTGGICLGNLNLEFLDAATVPLQNQDAVALVAFQRAPHSMTDLTDALGARGLDVLMSFAFDHEIFGFSNVVVAPMVTEFTFFCSYHYPGAHDNALRRAELDAVDGGRLGLRGVSEIRANVDVHACTTLLGPPADDRWRFDTGPDLVIDTSVPAGTAAMTWSVCDPSSAPTIDAFPVSFNKADVERPAGLAGRRAGHV